MTAIAMDRPSYPSPSGDDIDTMAAGVIRLNRSPMSDNDIEYEEIEDTDNGMAAYQNEEEEDIAEYWDPYLYQLQQQAPKPMKVVCTKILDDRPSWYGDEYHGSITRDETSKLLGKDNGRYLVRQGLSQPGSYSLSFVYGLSVKHYHLHFQDGEYFVGETTFDDIEDLVADGLIALYMEENNVDEYLKSARESTEVRRTSVLPNIIEPVQEKERSEPLPPPLPPRNRGSIGKAPPVSPRIDQDDEGSSDVYINVQPSRDKNKDASLFHYVKPHNFKVHTFYNMPWCDYCKNFLWGLKKQGFKCKDCGYVTHKQCKDCAPSDCQPTRQLIKRAYGVDLTTLLKTHGTKVPFVIKECVDELERRGLDLEGIYRVPGKSLEVLQIKKSYDQELSCDFSLYTDSHAIAGALKLYFRELPIPLITFDCYELILVAARCSKLEETLETIKVILDRLPLAHYNTLRFLMKHLNNVQSQKVQNKMDCKNLAVVFAPSIIRPPANYDELLGMMKLPEQKKVTDVLVSHYTTLFR